MISYHQQIAEYYPINYPSNHDLSHPHYQTLIAIANYLYNNTKKPRPSNPYTHGNYLFGYNASKKWFYRPTLRRKQVEIHHNEYGQQIWYALKLVRTHGGGGRRPIMEIGTIHITDTHLHIIIKHKHEPKWFSPDPIELELANPNTIHNLIPTIDHLITKAENTPNSIFQEVSP